MEAGAVRAGVFHDVCIERMVCGPVAYPLATYAKRNCPALPAVRCVARKALLCELGVPGTRRGQTRSLPAGSGPPCLCAECRGQ